MIMQNRDCLAWFPIYLASTFCIQTRLAADGSLEHSAEASWNPGPLSQCGNFRQRHRGAGGGIFLGKCFRYSSNQNNFWWLRFPLRTELSSLTIPSPALGTERGIHKFLENSFEFRNLIVQNQSISLLWRLDSVQCWTWNISVSRKTANRLHVAMQTMYFGKSFCLPVDSLPWRKTINSCCSLLLSA